MKRVTLFLLIWEASINLLAQKPAVIDLTKEDATNISDLPFDKPVIIKLKSPNDYIGDIKLVELKGKLRRTFKDSLPTLENNVKRDNFLHHWLNQNHYLEYPRIPKSNFAYPYYGFIDNDKKDNSIFIRIESLITKEIEDKSIFIPNSFESEKDIKLINDYKNANSVAPIQQAQFNSKNERLRTPKQEIVISYFNRRNNRPESKPNSSTKIEEFYLKPKSNYLLIINANKDVDITKTGICNELISYSVKEKLAAVTNGDEIELSKLNLSDITNERDKLNVKSTYNYEIIRLKENSIRTTSIAAPNLTNLIIGLNFIYETYSDRSRNEFGKLNRFYKDSLIFISYGKIIKINDGSNPLSLEKIAKGLDNLLDWNINENPDITNQEKIKNLTKSLKVLTSHKLITDYLSAIGYTTTLKPYSDIINELYKNCDNNLVRYQRIIKAEQEIIEEAVSRNLPDAIQETSLLGNSDIYDFETRSKFAITPEFGYIFIPKGLGVKQGPITTNNQTETFPISQFNTPFVGFHINFRYWDKNIPFNNNPNTKFGKWNQGARLSWMLGYTLGNFKFDYAAPIFSNGNNLITGIGIRLGNAVRIVSGVMFYNRISGSITKTGPSGFKEIKKIVTDNQGVTQTVIESVPNTEVSITEDLKTTLKPAFFFGISLDLSLKLLSGDNISNLIPFKLTK